MAATPRRDWPCGLKGHGGSEWLSAWILANQAPSIRTAIRRTSGTADADEITAYASRLYQIQNKDKALHDFVEWDSEVEKSFAEALDAREEVKLFFKLPRWFQIPTPVGSYNPDWAIVAGDPDKVYLIRETKSTGDVTKRRESENQKIRFGELHFKALSRNPADAVDFKDCVTLQEALNSLT